MSYDCGSDSSNYRVNSKDILYSFKLQIWDKQEIELEPQIVKMDPYKIGIFFLGNDGEDCIFLVIVFRFVIVKPDEPRNLNVSHDLTVIRWDKPEKLRNFPLGELIILSSLTETQFLLK